MRVSSIAASAAADLVADGIELEVVEAQRLAVLLPARAAQQRAQAGEQLLERERLGQVVVGARLQARDAVADAVARGEHQDRRAVAGVAQPAADLEAVEPGHQDVEQDRVGAAPSAWARTASRPSPASATSKPSTSQDPLEHLAHGGLVVDDQDAHRRDRRRRT